MIAKTLNLQYRNIHHAFLRENKRKYKRRKPTKQMVTPEVGRRLYVIERRASSSFPPPNKRSAIISAVRKEDPLHLKD